MTDSVVRRFPSKRNALLTLRKYGVEFGSIVDVGVQSSTKELVEVFPDKPHYLFEPVAEYAPLIAKNYAHINHKLFQVAASDKDGQGHLKLVSADGSGSVTHSQVSSAQAPNTISVPLVTVTKIATEHGFQPRITLANSLGFSLWDICDLCYRHGSLWQVDLIFLSPDLIAGPQMQPPTDKGRVDWSEWHMFSREEENLPNPGR
jgi:hypothetical protein